MLWRNVIQLVPLEKVKDEIGSETITEGVPREVFSNRLSIGRTEFYQAKAAGINPTVEFEVRFDEYKGETVIYDEDKKYHIIRTYTKNEEILKLVCSFHSTEGDFGG